MIYEKCLVPVEARSITHKKVEFQVFVLQMQPQGPNETCKGQNKLFQNASLSICFCFATGHFFKTLKTLSVRHDIESLFKVQISSYHPTGNTQTRVMFLRPSLFCEFYSTFNGNFHYKSFCHFSFEPMGIFIR